MTQIIYAIFAGLGAAITWTHIIDIPFRLKLLFKITPWKPIPGLDCFFCTAFWFMILSVVIHATFEFPNWFSFPFVLIAAARLAANQIDP